MHHYKEEMRPIDVGNYIVEHKATIRQAAKKFGIGRSTVFRDIHDKLPKINKQLSISVLNIIEANKSERHIRGGNATKLKYSSKLV